MIKRIQGIKRIHDEDAAPAPDPPPGWRLCAPPSRLADKHALVTRRVMMLWHLRQRVRYTRGAGNLFNDVRPPRSRGNKSGWRRADLVIDGYSGIGRHLFLDVAIPDPCCPSARAAGSVTSTGVAASAEEKIKQNK